MVQKKTQLQPKSAFLWTTTEQSQARNIDERRNGNAKPAHREVEDESTRRHACVAFLVHAICDTQRVADLGRRIVSEAREMSATTRV